MLGSAMTSHRIGLYFQSCTHLVSLKMGVYSYLLQYGGNFSSMDNVRPLHIALASGAAVLGAAALYQLLKKTPNLPPGPSALPLVGNIWGS